MRPTTTISFIHTKYPVIQSNHVRVVFTIGIYISLHTVYNTLMVLDAYIQMICILSNVCYVRTSINKIIQTKHFICV